MRRWSAECMRGRRPFPAESPDKDVNASRAVAPVTRVPRQRAKKEGALDRSAQATSSPATEALVTKSATKALPHAATAVQACETPRSTTCRPRGNIRSASSPPRGGIFGSNSPDTSSVGTFSCLLSKSSGERGPAVHCRHTSMIMRTRERPRNVAPSSRRAWSRSSRRARRWSTKRTGASRSRAAGNVRAGSARLDWSGLLCYHSRRRAAGAGVARGRVRLHGGHQRRRYRVAMDDDRIRHCAAGEHVTDGTTRRARQDGVEVRVPRATARPLQPA